jgi:hypothetical protein
LIADTRFPPDRKFHLKEVASYATVDHSPY